KGVTAPMHVATIAHAVTTVRKLARDRRLLHLRPYSALPKTPISADPFKRRRLREPVRPPYPERPERDRGRSRRAIASAHRPSSREWPSPCDWTPRRRSRQPNGRG